MRFCWTQQNRSCIQVGMRVARGKAEPAKERRESSHPASTADVQIRVDKEEYIGLRWAAKYWKVRHAAAVEIE